MPYQERIAPMTNRSDEQLNWLREDLGLAVAALERASEDASFRSYWRCRIDGQSCILMDAPVEHEDCAPFVRIASLLHEHGLHAPRILHQDLKRGFLLLEDLGTMTYSDAFESRDPETLYADAIDALIRMQGIDSASLPVYDERLLMAEMDLFHDWLIREHLGLQLEGDDLQHWQRTRQILCDKALEQPTVLVHRDYHSRNLMVTSENNPGIIDFQDAVRGPISYDLVSLLRDCYQVWPQAMVESMLQRYLSQAEQTLSRSLNAQTFAVWFDWMGIQRHLKASGIFCRLHHRDGKSGYLKDIPATLSYVIDVTERYPELHWLADLISSRILMSFNPPRAVTT